MLLGINSNLAPLPITAAELWARCFIIARLSSAVGYDFGISPLTAVTAV